jgi:hypothetical protein
VTETQIVMIVMVAAIVGTGIALYRQRVLPLSGLVAVAVATTGIGSFLFFTLAPP